ncbi:hypothetical protein AB0F71_28735 [Kitasatospora sp. NPDC028055]|uniref:hypothetical protein n=1 Tax=Kitasatospora sp. NPDC028055 TaxID=3155653 RepID=UPI0033C76C4E
MRVVQSIRPHDGPHHQTAAQRPFIGFLRAFDGGGGQRAVRLDGQQLVVGEEGQLVDAGPNVVGALDSLHPVRRGLSTAFPLIIEKDVDHVSRRDDTLDLRLERGESGLDKPFRDHERVHRRDALAIGHGNHPGRFEPLQDRSQLADAHPDRQRESLDTQARRTQRGSVDEFLVLRDPKM